MKKHILIILTVIILIPFAGCKKYPEGPLISLRSVEKRLEGKWEVEKYYINDINSTLNYNNDFGCNLNLTLKVSGDPLGPSYGLNNCSNDSVPFQAGFWSLKNDDGYKYAKISFSVIYSTYDSLNHGIGVFGTDTLTTWDIKKLTNKHFNIETKLRGEHYRVELIKN